MGNAQSLSRDSGTAMVKSYFDNMPSELILMTCTSLVKESFGKEAIGKFDEIQRIDTGLTSLLEVYPAMAIPLRAAIIAQKQRWQLPMDALTAVFGQMTEFELDNRTIIEAATAHLGPAIQGNEQALANWVAQNPGANHVLQGPYRENALRAVITFTEAGLLPCRPSPSMPRAQVYAEFVQTIPIIRLHRAVCHNRVLTRQMWTLAHHSFETVIPRQWERVYGYNMWAAWGDFLEQEQRFNRWLDQCSSALGGNQTDPSPPGAFQPE